MVLNLLRSKDKYKIQNTRTLLSFSSLLRFFWFEDSLSQHSQKVEEAHAEDATPETDDSDENWLKIWDWASHHTGHWLTTHMEVHTAEKWFCLLNLLRGIISVHGLRWTGREKGEEDAEDVEEMCHGDDVVV